MSGTSHTELERRLAPPFAPKHVSSMLKHYSEAIDALQKNQWQIVITRSGQFIEAVLKALWLHVGGTLPRARQFKAGKVCQDLKQLGAGAFSDSVRITIPRACEFAYDIASNRGARHDPDEVDPNEIDAHAVLNAAAWVLAEMVRIAQRGAANPAQTRQLLSTLVERHYPIVEEIEGRTYFHIRGLSARKLALLVLWHKYPARQSRGDVVDALERNGVSKRNALTAVSRLAGTVDETSEGLRLLRPGVEEAEAIVASATGE